MLNLNARLKKRCERENNCTHKSKKLHHYGQNRDTAGPQLKGGQRNMYMDMARRKPPKLEIIHDIESLFYFLLSSCVTSLHALVLSGEIVRVLAKLGSFCKASGTK